MLAYQATTRQQSASPPSPKAKIGISSCLMVGFGYYGTLQAADFAVVTNVNEFNAAAGSTAKIIYNSSNSDLYYNADGATAGLGNGSQFATVQGRPALTVNDLQQIWIYTQLSQSVSQQLIFSSISSLFFSFSPSSLNIGSKRTLPKSSTRSKFRYPLFLDTLIL